MIERLSSYNPEFEGSQAIANILRTIGEEYGFDGETCDEIEALPFSEAFEVAYGYLMQAGLDPYRVLEAFIELDE